MSAIATRLKWVQEEFDHIAVNGFLGEPNGKPGMAYLRVSSVGQAEEGRTGFPRQLMHVSSKAQELHIAIPWELVFFDDHTGFQFRDRPGLTRLRQLVKQHPRPADDLIIENLDRLSREASWHQGYLLDELEHDCKVGVHFWKELGTKLERAVYGTVAQDRMLTDLERMATGNLLKAKSQRVTAHVAAYGFKLVNSTGGEENAKKDTHYAIYEPEARFVRRMYAWLVEEHVTLHEVSRRLIAKHIKPPKKSKTWEMSLLHKIITNPVYKGEFYAHRVTQVRRISKHTGKEVIGTILRPRDQWILVPVPAIVSPESWELAQKVIQGNRNKALRNSKGEYLLASVAYCAECGLKFHVKPRFQEKQTKQGPKHYEMTYYRCGGRDASRHIRDAMGRHCSMPQMSRKLLDPIVWHNILNVLLDGERLNEGMERYFSKQTSVTTREEIAYLQAQITVLDVEDEMLYPAYIAKAFNAQEYASKRQVIQDKKSSLETEKEEVQRRLTLLTEKQARKDRILASVEELRKRAGDEAPFELQRRILMLVVDKITLNIREEWMDLEGAIAGKFDFTSAPATLWPST